jgi:hypothetical protein
LVGSPRASCTSFLPGRRSAHGGEDDLADEGENELGCSHVGSGRSPTLDLENLEPGTCTSYRDVDAHEGAGNERHTVQCRV